MTKLLITEHQQTSDGRKAWPSDYRYCGMQDGLHAFEEHGKRELFTKRKNVAGWHLRRGAWSYEFCRSA
jgi:hypothetical protein